MADLGRSNHQVSSLITSLEQSLQELRAAGRINEALQGIERAKTEMSLQAFECHYARQDYDSCAAVLKGLGDSPKVLSRMIYLYAHAPGYRDEGALLRAAEELGYDSTHVVTALALAAREEGSAISAKDVYKYADAILANRALQYASVSDAYLLLSCGRLALAQKDYDRALDFLDKADIAYPRARYLVQHAEIHLARAEAFESKGDKGAASEATGKAIIELSLQSHAEPSNTYSKVKLAEAHSRYKALEASRLGDLITPAFERAVLGENPE
jgi:tetratricopeptide (TPR) repeat protein